MLDAIREAQDLCAEESESELDNSVNSNDNRVPQILDFDVNQIIKSYKKHYYEVQKNSMGQLRANYDHAVYEQLRANFSSHAGLPMVEALARR